MRAALNLPVVVAPKSGPAARAVRISVFTAAAVIACIGFGDAWAQRRERSGQEVIEAACAQCHVRGEGGAPRIGDEKAWATRASQGLSALSANAVKGIRAMPAHGGNPNVSDIEIERAIVQMVNASGGRWVMPLGGTTPAVLRTSEQIVDTVCSKCHKDGVNSAPKIGDRAAWIPRLSKGLDALVKSAVNGYGPMPSRGSAADLSDVEIRGAVIYMFNYGVAMPAPQPAAATTSAGASPLHKTIEGADVYLGVIRADRMPAAPGAGTPPSGRDVFHVNLSLIDSRTQMPITDAKIKLRVADGLRAEERTLDLVAAGQSVSYGGYFRMPNPNPYTISAQIERAGTAGPVELTFDYRPPR